ncbi:uncharacterized protein TM35_000016070 [Trypanosoma theileri]|uniref:Uncharacterized protein n=1 Tax=Trypanosoma theileri TaxID=67003 RepID=A0A1X0PBA8_9TRYP|nr:uncharacterized protein TM35_000016070 [Trypanosoma theileri]ORC93730.1 hypothetical protein TM35_000016070 [Trypanosoma theileri]
MDKYHALPEASYILGRVKGDRSYHYNSRESFEKLCADMVLLWSTPDNGDAFSDDGPQQQKKGNEEVMVELNSLWPSFLKEATLYVAKESPLQSSRSLLEAIVASVEFSVVSKYGGKIAVANTACVEEIIQILVSDICQRKISLSSLIPPLWEMQKVTVIVELLQEYYLFCGDANSTVTTDTGIVSNNASATTVKLIESYNALVDRYIGLFVEEMVFPDYWNLNWSSSSSVILVNGVHPSIYFCFTSMANLVYGWMHRPYLTDNRPCHEIVARVWERGALAIASVAEEKQLSSPREKQIQLDTMHFVLFARMFRGFIGENFSKCVTVALVRLLEAVAKCVRKVETSQSQGFITFEKEIWDVPPIQDLEWPRTDILKNDSNDEEEKKTSTHIVSSGAFIPWCNEFIRASHVKVAQGPPMDWEHTIFQKLH